jgi:hypothetical protein
LKKQKLSLETDIIPFLSNIILSKIKEKPVLFTLSGKNMKKFELLPKIDEEHEANMASEKSQKTPGRTHSEDFLNFVEDEPSEESLLLRTSTQKFSNMKFELELDVHEANKHFNRANKEEVKHDDDPFDYQTQPISVAAKMRKEFMIDENVMKATKEVPSGPKSKSVPRNTDFFSSKQEEENNLIIESGAPPSKGIKGVIKKRFAFLDIGGKEEEEEEEVKEPPKKKSKIVLNPAATGATEYQSDTSSERSEMLNFKGKSQFRKPVIDTEAINEMFSYGGEKGDLLIRLDDEEDQNEAFLKELDDIASICVAAMNRSSPDEEIIVEDPVDASNKPSDSGIDSSEDYTFKPLKKQKDFMTPQTVKGYTKVEFIKNINQLKPYMQPETEIIKEESSPQATSKSGSSKPELNTPTSNLTLDTPKTLLEKQAFEEYNSGIEALYSSILEWLLSRSPSNLNEPLMIDDSDEIQNPNVLIICFNLIKHSSDLLKQKALQDFQMLCKLNKSNCTHIIENKFFHPWILELLLPYQMNLSQEKLTGSSMAVYDIGTKLHTIVMVHSLVNEAKNRFILYLARWPLILSYKDKTEFKITHKIECAYQLLKHLLSSIIKSVSIEASKCRPCVEHPIWTNVARIVFIIDELVLNGKPTNIEFKQRIKPIYEDFIQVLNRTMTRTQENKKDKSVSFLLSET